MVKHLRFYSKWYSPILPHIQIANFLLFKYLTRPISMTAKQWWQVHKPNWVICKPTVKCQQKLWRKAYSLKLGSLEIYEYMGINIDFFSLLGDVSTSSFIIKHALSCISGIFAISFELYHSSFIFLLLDITMGDNTAVLHYHLKSIQLMSTSHHSLTVRISVHFLILTS